MPPPRTPCSKASRNRPRMRVLCCSARTVRCCCRPSFPGWQRSSWRFRRSNSARRRLKRSPPMPRRRNGGPPLRERAGISGGRSSCLARRNRRKRQRMRASCGRSWFSGTVIRRWKSWRLMTRTGRACLTCSRFWKRDLHRPRWPATVVRPQEGRKNAWPTAWPVNRRSVRLKQRRRLRNRRGGMSASRCSAPVWSNGSRLRSAGDRSRDIFFGRRESPLPKIWNR